MLFQKRLVAFLWIAAGFAAFSSCSKKGGADNTPVVANFTYSGAGLAPATVTFTNSSTGATSYQWDFGDNSTSTSSSPSHNYMQGGVYTVRLTANGPAGSNTVSKTVNITSPTSVKIIGVRVTGMPFTDANGAGWDNNTGPDVYFQFGTSTATQFSGTAINNVSSSNLPLLWNVAPGQTVTNLSATYQIAVWDQDTNDFPPSSDDYIGGYTFNFPSFAAQGYPSTLSIQNSSSLLKVELIVQWQ